MSLLSKLEDTKVSVDDQQHKLARFQSILKDATTRLRLGESEHLVLARLRVAGYTGLVLDLTEPVEECRL